MFLSDHWGSTTTVGDDMHNVRVTYIPKDLEAAPTVPVTIRTEFMDEAACTEAAEKFKAANHDRSHNIDDYKIDYFFSYADSNDG
jgi:hypothetical protein